MNDLEDEQWVKKAAILLISQMISLFGSAIVGFAIIWHITLETSSGSLLTIAILCTFLPQILISLFAGVWADMYSRKKLIIISDIFISLATLGLALFYLSGETSLKLIFIASIIRSIGSGVQAPAVNALLPQIVPTEKLTRVNGIYSTISSAMMLLSPAVGGLLLATAGFAYALLFDVVSAAIAVILLTLLKTEPVRRNNEAASTIEELKRGLNYTREHAILKYLLVFYALFFFLVSPAAFLTPLMVERSFGGDVWRLTANELAWTTGSLLGGVFIAMRGEFKNKVYTMAIACLAFGITFIMLGVARNFVVYLAIMLVSGIFMPVFGTSEIVLIQERVEEQMLGRVFSVVHLIASVAMPLGMLVFGPLADTIKIEYMIIGTGVGLCILALCIISNTKILRLGEADSK
jgi:DHA3 family macrolide efflux protein-like MFS transporter